MFAIRVGFAVNAKLATPSVSPSGAALATADIPIVAPPPGLLTHRMGWPSRVDRSGAITRKVVWTDPPAENGTTISIGRLELDRCAAAGPARQTQARKATAARDATIVDAREVFIAADDSRIKSRVNDCLTISLCGMEATQGRTSKRGPATRIGTTRRSRLTW